MFFISKVLQEFLYPFNLTMMLLALGLWWLRKGKVRQSGWAVSIAFFLLLVPGMSFVGDTMLANLESAYPSRMTADYPNADAIVVLGGTTMPTRPPRLEAEEPHGARLLQAARLFRAGKAPIIIVTGGLRYRIEGGGSRAEADDMRDVLLGMGVPPEAIINEDQSRTTYENAVLTAQIMRERNLKTVLLVTSAFHMPRAVGLFQAQNIELTPVPCHYLVVQSDFGWRMFHPTPSGVGRTTMGIKEYAGRLAYWVMGKS